MDERTQTAQELRRLADQLDAGSDFGDEWLAAAQRAVHGCWRGRDFPAGCRALLDLLQRPAAGGAVEVQLAKPNDESTVVGVILCAGVPEAVVKYRGDSPAKAFREECHYVFAEQLGLGQVVAPCVAMELTLLGAHSFPPSGGSLDNCVLELLRKHTAAWHAAQENPSSDTWPTHVWVTIEKCVRLSTSSEPAKDAQRLTNVFGCIDLMQAYASTPDGRDCGEDALLRDWYREEPSDADFYQVLSRLDVECVHQLCILATITLQRDGGPSNLMLRQKENEEKSIELVSIDATRVLNAYPQESLVLREKAEKIGPFTYWYPACIELPQAVEPIAPAVADAVLALDAGEVQTRLARRLLAAGVGSSGAFVRAEAEAQAAGARLRQMQQILSTGRPAARELCFRVVPIWQADYWAPSRRIMVPFRQIEAHMRSGGTAESWERRCLQRCPGDARAHTQGEQSRIAREFL
ncbi:unnamed protein product [Effrenium voratum]|uniref:Uncharacterized protein n=1 Tax=Effrenium voratum TaxID=2562239 RepID=A0AA36J7J5_9DINO|nr:unnamed protein product [Effrenium voratum]